MKQTLLAFDIGTSQVKLALRRRGKEPQIVAVQTPDNLFKDGQIRSPHLMAGFIRVLCKDYNLPRQNCALVVPNSAVVCRTLRLPAMSTKQLELNLSFEFADYISDEPQKYVYDYAMQEMVMGEDGKPAEMVMLGAAMSKKLSAWYVEMFHEAGMSLRTIVPQEMALTTLMRQMPDDNVGRCVINLGHSSTEVFFYRGSKLQFVRGIAMGGADLDQVIADGSKVDVIMARNYKHANFNGVWYQEYCKEAYNRLALEVIKAVNFYRYNNREAELNNVVFLGGGSVVEPLCQTIAESTGLSRVPAHYLWPQMTQDAAAGFLAYGALIQ